MKCIIGFAVVFCSLSISCSEFVSCELDLDDPDGAILAQQPGECHNLDESSKVLLLEEAISFNRFQKKLLDYEAAQDHNTEDEIYMDMDLRRELYTAADLHECLNIEESLEEYVQCLVVKRDTMVSLIESKIQQA